MVAAYTPAPYRPDEEFDLLVEEVLRYGDPADIPKIRAAYEYALDKHAAQLRETRGPDGARLPYISHPIAVARILANLEMDAAGLCAGLLHDVIEDCNVTREELAEAFGEEIAAIVDGVTKLRTVAKQDAFQHDEAGHDATAAAHSQARIDRKQDTIKRAANLRKIFLAMATDLRVIIVKLADRLHNMRTLQAMEDAKRRRIARETLQIYAPLAHRLGIWKMKSELEDLAFSYLEPEAYARLKERVDETRADRDGEIAEAIQMLQERLASEGLPDAHVTGRPKHLYGIYEKMRQQGLEFAEIYDIVALRVIVNTRLECYQALMIVSGLWPPIPGMYGDYIARAKSNLYQSLHLKVIGPRGKPLEVQIRTWEMHRTAEFGVAAHWAYKEKGEGGKASDQFERKLNWLRQQLVDWQADAKDSREFLRAVTEELFADMVFVLTPKGEVIDLPAGATPIDFAYRIHSDVGNHAVGARVNGRMVPLSHKFQNGDVVDIITRSSSAPSRDWLAYARTAHARSKIRSYFKRQLHDEHVQKGRDILQREAERLGLDAHSLLKDDALRSIAPHFNVPNEAELLASIGYGTLGASSVLNRLKPPEPPAKGLVVNRERADTRKMKVRAGNIDNVSFRRAHCCLPIPGDEVVGYVTRGRGMTLHRLDCANVARYAQSEPERLNEVDYVSGDGQLYSVSVIIEAVDRKNLLADVGAVFGEQSINITEVHTKSHPNGMATLSIQAEVRDVDHLNRLFSSVRRLADVLNIVRANGAR